MESFVRRFIKNEFKGDSVIWTIYVLLAITSVVIVLSASSYDIAGSGETFKAISNHLMYLAISFVALLVIYILPQKIVKMLATLGLSASIVFLFLLFTVGESHQGASRNIAGIQPSELVKFSLIVVAAMLIDPFRKQEDYDGETQEQKLDREENSKRSRERSFKILCLVSWLAIGLVLPMNLSQAIIIAVPLIVMMVVGRVPLRKIGVFIGVPTIILALLILVASTVFSDSQSSIGKQLSKFRYQTWQARIEKFGGESLIDKWEQTTTNAEKWKLIRANDQVIYAKSAIYDGQQIGKGSGQSVWRNRIQEVSKDFVYAVILEEYGMVGGVAVIMLYLWLLWRGGVLISRARYRFQALVILGSVTLIAFQAFVHIGVCTGTIPVTGQTLPMISKGGTSLFVMGAMFGLMLGMSRILDEEGQKELLLEAEAEAEEAQDNVQQPTTAETVAGTASAEQESVSEEIPVDELSEESDELIEVIEDDTIKEIDDFDSVFEEYKED